MDKYFDIVVYHDPCSDGISAMWAVKHSLPNIMTLECKAGRCNTLDLSLFENKRVIFVDICPTMEELENMSNVANWITVLDHHDSSVKAYKLYYNNDDYLGVVHGNIEIYLDMKRSGCQMSWDYFNPSISPSKTRPWFLNYVADRDLWQWKLEYSKEYNTAFFDLGYMTKDKINELYTMTDNKKRELLTYGIDAVKKFNKTIDNICKNAKVARIGDYYCWLITCTYKYRSDVGNRLSNICLPSGLMPDFTAIWTCDPESNDKWISLRNIEGLNLSDVCKEFDNKGGGHPRAAGFTIYDNTLESLFTIDETSDLDEYIVGQLIKK